MKKKNRIRVNEKDIEFFFYLHSVKASRRDQVGRDIYPHLKKWALYKRLRMLEKEGLIQGIVPMDSQEKKVYSITKKAFNKYLLEGKVKKKEFKSYAFKHDMRLVDIRYKLLKCKTVTNFVLENSLQTWPSSYFDWDIKPYLRCHSDAIVEITVDGDSAILALEYELTSKSTIRYQELITQYYWEYSIPVVLYIAESSQTLDKVMGVEKKLDKEKRGKFFYTTFENLLQKKEISFTNWKGDVINW